MVCILNIVLFLFVFNRHKNGQRPALFDDDLLLCHLDGPNKWGGTSARQSVAYSLDGRRGQKSAKANTERRDVDRLLYIVTS